MVGFLRVSKRFLVLLNGGLNLHSRDCLFIVSFCKLLFCKSIFTSPALVFLLSTWSVDVYIT